MVGSPRVEILSFAGCPNVEKTREMVEAALAAAGVVPEFRLTEVTSQAETECLRFLGSPSVRVDEGRAREARPLHLRRCAGDARNR